MHVLVLISTGPVQWLGQPWLASWLGTPSPRWGWWAPVAQPYNVEVGIRGFGYLVHPRSLFPTVLTLVRSRGRGWPRREAATSAGHCTATSPPLRHAAMPLRPRRPRLQLAGPRPLRWRVHGSPPPPGHHCTAPSLPLHTRRRHGGRRGYKQGISSKEKSFHPLDLLLGDPKNRTMVPEPI